MENAAINGPRRHRGAPNCARVFTCILEKAGNIFFRRAFIKAVEFVALLATSVLVERLDAHWTVSWLMRTKI
jgi:hypothetical protein